MTAIAARSKIVNVIYVTFCYVDAVVLARVGAVDRPSKASPGPAGNSVIRPVGGRRRSAGTVGHSGSYYA